MRKLLFLAVASVATGLHAATNVSGELTLSAPPADGALPFVIVGDATITFAAGVGEASIASIENDGHDLTVNLEAGAAPHLAWITTKNGGTTRVNFKGGKLTDNGGWSTPWFETDATSRTELNSIDGNDIMLTHPWSQKKYLHRGEGRMTTSGTGRLVIRTAGQYNGNALWCDLKNMPSTNYLHTGGTVFCHNNGNEAGHIVVSEYWTLPPGRIEIGGQDRTWGWGAIVNLNYTQQTADQIVLASKYGYVTNDTQVTAMLSFPRENALLDCPVYGGVRVIKSNAATTMTVKRGPVSQLDVTAGTALIKPDTTGAKIVFGKLALYKGAKIVIDGANVETANFNNLGGTVETLNGGSLTAVLDAPAKTIVDADEAASAQVGTIVKTGPGALYYAGDTALDATRLRVAEGAMKFTGPVGTTNAWWRFTAMQSATAGGTLSIGPMRLLDKDLNFADGAGNGLNYKYSISSKAVPDFDPMTYVCSSTDCVTEKSGSDNPTPPYAIWCSSSVYDCTFLSPKPRLDDPATWITWTYRIAQNMPTIRGYNLKTQWGNFNNWPRSWQLESSPDGITWEMMDAQTNYTDLVNGQQWYHGGGQGVGGNDGTPSTKIGFAALTPSLPTAGGLPATVDVQVDAGATLDCSLVTGGQTIAGLTIDSALGGGTLRGVTLAAEGVVTLVNVPDGKLKCGSAVPLAFEDVAGAANIANWSVTVNGKPSKKRIVWRNNALEVDSYGLRIYIR